MGLHNSSQVIKQRAIETTPRLRRILLKLLRGEVLSAKEAKVYFDHAEDFACLVRKHKGKRIGVRKKYNSNPPGICECCARAVRGQLTLCALCAAGICGKTDCPDLKRSGKRIKVRKRKKYRDNDSLAEHTLQYLYAMRDKLASEQDPTEQAKLRLALSTSAALLVKEWPDLADRIIREHGFISNPDILDANGPMIRQEEIMRANARKKRKRDLPPNPWAVCRAMQQKYGWSDAKTERCIDKVKKATGYRKGMKTWKAEDNPPPPRYMKKGVYKELSAFKRDAAIQDIVYFLRHLEKAVRHNKKKTADECLQYLIDYETYAVSKASPEFVPPVKAAVDYARKIYNSKWGGIVSPVQPIAGHGGPLYPALFPAPTTEAEESEIPIPYSPARPSVAEMPVAEEMSAMPEEESPQAVPPPGMALDDPYRQNPYRDNPLRYGEFVLGKFRSWEEARDAVPRLQEQHRYKFFQFKIVSLDEYLWAVVARRVPEAMYRLGYTKKRVIPVPPTPGGMHQYVENPNPRAPLNTREMQDYDLQHDESEVRLLEMLVDGGATDQRVVMQFWSDVGLYGLREAFIYLQGYAGQGLWKGNLNEVKTQVNKLLRRHGRGNFVPNPGPIIPPDDDDDEDDEDNEEEFPYVEP